MKHELLREVGLTRDILEQGLRAGDIGTVVYVHGEDGYEVEFALMSGEARAVLTLRAADIRRPGDDEILAVRSSAAPVPG